jgi:hypothetical protein
MTTMPQRAPAGRWKQAAGAATAVAVLIVSQATAAGAATASPPTPTQTLSTGAYSWHVATPTTDAATDQRAGGAPLHGEFPVVTVDGRVQIRRWQWGAVAALSPDAVTVVSDDGYTSDYLVGAGMGIQPELDSVTVGELVTVVGTVEASDEPAAG